MLLPGADVPQVPTVAYGRQPAPVGAEPNPALSVFHEQLFDQLTGGSFPNLYAEAVLAARSHPPPVGAYCCEGRIVVRSEPDWLLGPVCVQYLCTSVNAHGQHAAVAAAGKVLANARDRQPPWWADARLG